MINTTRRGVSILTAASLHRMMMPWYRAGAVLILGTITHATTINQYKEADNTPMGKQPAASGTRRGSATKDTRPNFVFMLADGMCGHATGVVM